MDFWSKNIGGFGRVMRALAGLASLGMAFWFYKNAPTWPAWPLGAVGLFCLFEAARGWCVARACKIRTPF